MSEESVPSGSFRHDSPHAPSAELMGEFALLMARVGAVRSSCEAIGLEANELRAYPGLLRAEARRLRDESGRAVGRSTSARGTRSRIRPARRRMS
jgi:hypothetical protein